MKCVFVKDHLHRFYLYLISLKTASKKVLQVLVRVGLERAVDLKSRKKKKTTFVQLQSVTGE